MLGLLSETTRSWVRSAERDLDALLIDHAHCEKKAAGVAVNLIFSYIEFPVFASQLAEIGEEELQHFRAVLDLLRQRGIAIRGQPPSSYGKRLAALIRKEEPSRAVDRCLVAALIEARSCDRFTALSQHLEDADLRAFFARLLESEARHYGVYINLAEIFAPKSIIRRRFEELRRDEARIISLGDELVRLHS